jgi:hypothetical protein
MTYGLIFRHYAKTWMLPDTIFLLTDWFIILVDKARIVGVTDVLRAGKLFKSLRMLRVLRVIRLRKMYLGMDQFDMVVNSTYFSIVVRIMRNILGILLCSHFTGCTWYFVGSSGYGGSDTWVIAGGFQERGWCWSYLTAFHWALTQFTPGSMEVQPQNDVERLFAIMVLVGGMVIFSSIVSSITQATNTLKDMNSHYDKMLWDMRRYIREQSISPELAGKVLSYSERVVRPKMRKVTKEEVEMFKKLPETLYMDMCLEIYDQDFDGHILFTDLLKNRRGLMQRVSRYAMLEASYSKEDELFCPGQICVHMYFVRDGRMAYAQEGDSEVSYIGRGEDYDAWLCEAALWTVWTHQGSCAARNECALISLDCKKFIEVAQCYRSSFWVLQDYGKHYVDAMNARAKAEWDSASESSPDVSDLFQLDAEVSQSFSASIAQFCFGQS